MSAPPTFTVPYEATHAHGGATPASSGEERIFPAHYQGIDQVVDTCWRLVEKEMFHRGYGQAEVKIHIALTEAVINAWKHGNRRNPDLPILFRWRFDDHFTFEVHDNGSGFDHQALPDPTQPEHITDESGRGLFIIRASASSVEWRDQGRHLIVRFSPPTRG